MNRIDRLNAILIHLQGKPRTTVDELEDKYELSRRTIFRDIRALIDSGVPIGGDAGEGYFIVEGYHLPPVVFDQKEAAAILMGSKFVQHLSDSEMASSHNSAMEKVKAVLRYSDKEFLDNLDQGINIMPPPNVASNPSQEINIAELQFAIASRRTVQFDYYSTYQDSHTSRQVRPLGLVHYANRWHLIGYCLLREDLRDFRADRITKLTVLNETFDPTEHPNYMDFLSDNLRGTDAQRAEIFVTDDLSRFIVDQKYYHGFVDEQKVEGGYKMTFYVNSYLFFAQWLMTLGNWAKIITPPELHMEAKKLVEVLREHYQ